MLDKSLRSAILLYRFDFVCLWRQPIDPRRFHWPRVAS